MNDDQQVTKEETTAPQKVDFGTALWALKAGKRCARSGWNGKGMYLYLVPGQTFKSLTDHAKKEFGDMTPYRPYFALKTAQNDIAMWSPSGSDALAEDWVILPKQMKLTDKGEKLLQELNKNNGKN